MENQENDRKHNGRNTREAICTQKEGERERAFWPDSGILMLGAAAIGKSTQLKRFALVALELGMSSEECGDTGISRKHAFGFAALMIGMLMFGGSLIDSLLLGGTRSICLDTEAGCQSWAAAGECERNSAVRILA